MNAETIITGRHYKFWMASVFIAAAGAWCMHLAKSDTHAHREQILPRVSIGLLKSQDSIVGMNVARNIFPIPSITSADLLTPSDLTLLLPDGNTVHLAARSISWSADSGFVTDVYVRRPLQTGTFHAVVADLKKTLEAIGVKPDEFAKNAMSTWPDDMPGMESGVFQNKFTTGIPRALGNIGVFIEVSPDPSAGWYYLLIFEAAIDDRPSAKNRKSR